MSSCNENADIQQSSGLLLGRNLISSMPATSAPLPGCLTGKNLISDEHNEDEMSELSMSRSQLFTALSEVCSAQPDRLAHGEWLCEVGRVRLDEKVASSKTVQQMGYTLSGVKGLFLYPEEAVFLVESALLEIIFRGMPLSLQQCYQTILSGGEISLDEYLAYTQLIRLGYVARRHDHSLTVSQYERQIGLDRYIAKRKFTCHEDSFTIKGESKEVSSVSSKELNYIDLDLSDRNVFTVGASTLPSGGCESVAQQLSVGGVQPLLLPDSEQTTAAVMEKLAGCFKFEGAITVPDSSPKIMFDVYGPDSAFSKKKRVLPDYFLYIVRSSDPFPLLEDLQGFPGVATLLAIVDCQNVCFQCLKSEQLPALRPHFS